MSRINFIYNELDVVIIKIRYLSYQFSFEIYDKLFTIQVPK